MIRKFLVVSGVSLIVMIIGFGLLFLENQPILQPAPPPTAQDVAAVRQFVRDIRITAGQDGQSGDALLATTEQLNSIARLGSRFIDGFRGRVSVEANRIKGEGSLPIPWWTGRKWLNITAEAPPFTDTFALSRVTVGAWNIPPGLALFLTRVSANLVVGNKFGDKVLQSASSMEITGDTLRFNISLDAVGRNGVMRGTFGMLRGAQMPDAAEVEEFHVRIRDAMARGDLPVAGSFLPYLEFIFADVLARSTPETLSNVYTAAIFGLAKVCGARDFSMIVGRLAFNEANQEQNWQVSCSEITFNGRIDSRRHFITSAALQAASNRGVAISLGEFKELYDTISGAGGFDFTDMAANLSGIRMSNMLMALPQAAWPARLALLETENDVITSFDGIPPLMPEAEFKARFRDVDSTAYKAMLARIEARIDDLRLHRGI